MADGLAGRLRGVYEDLHKHPVTCLPGAASQLAASRSDWSGTLVTVFQPSEETVQGAAAMVADGLYERVDSAPAVTNDAAATDRTRDALTSVVGPGHVIDPGLVTGSEDVGVLATAAGAPIVYWLLGGAAPAALAGATGHEDLVRIVAGLPSNHSPRYAPVEEPTIRIGVGAPSAAAREWLAGTSQARPAG